MCLSSPEESRFIPTRCCTEGDRGEKRPQCKFRLPLSPSAVQGKEASLLLPPSIFLSSLHISLHPCKRPHSAKGCYFQAQGEQTLPSRDWMLHLPSLPPIGLVLLLLQMPEGELCVLCWAASILRFISEWGRSSCCFPKPLDIFSAYLHGPLTTCVPSENRSLTLALFYSPEVLYSKLKGSRSPLAF